MVGPLSNLGTFHSLSNFSIKMPSPSNSTTVVKLQTLLRTLITSQVCRVARALSKAKSFLIEIVRKGQPMYFIYVAKKNKKSKMYIGSFRMYYNWCSSRSFSVPASVLDGFRPNNLYYDPSWNSALPAEKCECNESEGESQLSGYLLWLEEKTKMKEMSGNNNNGEPNHNSDNINEIDMLADVFIAKCHEKFILEKQESDRRFQEMLARSI